MAFVRINSADIEVGQPLRWSLYDDRKSLVMTRGKLIDSESQKAALIERGLFRSVSQGGAREGAAAPSEDLRLLEDVKLDIGDTLQLQVHSDAAPTRYYVKLIGFLKGKSVIVTTPTQDGKVLLMREGQTFVVRMFSGKSVYAFSAAIFKVANVPFPHLHLAYPAQVRGLVVRRGARARVNLIAAVSAANGRSHAATIVDLSLGGTMLTAKAPIGKKDERVAIKFRVEVNEVEQYLTIPALLRSVHATPAADGEAPLVCHGLQFDELPHVDQVVLSAFVYRTLFEESTEN